LEIECDDSQAKWEKRGYNKAVHLRQRNREVDVAFDLFEVIKQAKGNRFGIPLELETPRGHHANMVLWDKGRKEMYRYDSHGQTKSLSQDQVEALDASLYRIAKMLGYNYKGYFVEFCAPFQNLEKVCDVMSYIPMKKDGYCAAFSPLFALLWIALPDVSEARLQEMIFYLIGTRYCGIFRIFALRWSRWKF